MYKKFCLNFTSNSVQIIPWIFLKYIHGTALKLSLEVTFESWREIFRWFRSQNYPRIFLILCCYVHVVNSWRKLPFAHFPLLTFRHPTGPLGAGIVQEIQVILSRRWKRQRNVGFDDRSQQRCDHHRKHNRRRHAQRPLVDSVHLHGKLLATATGARIIGTLDKNKFTTKITLKRHSSIA